jgi:hypothetical protein
MGREGGEEEEEEQRKMKYQQLGQLFLIKIHIQKGTQSLGTFAIFGYY